MKPGFLRVSPTEALVNGTKKGHFFVRISPNSHRYTKIYIKHMRETLKTNRYKAKRNASLVGQSLQRNSGNAGSREHEVVATINRILVWRSKGIRGARYFQLPITCIRRLKGENGSHYGRRISVGGRIA